MTEQRTRLEILAHLAKVDREHAMAIVGIHGQIIRQMGVHPTDYKTLVTLDRFGPMSAGDLARHVGLAPASVTNLIERLVAKGFIRRQPDPDDRRKVLLSVDIDKLAQVDVASSAVDSRERMWDRYSYAELMVIADFLAVNTTRLRAEVDAMDRR